MPLKQMSAQPMYSDRAGSVVDHDALVANNLSVKPVREFVHALSGAADDSQGLPGDTEKRCVDGMLEAWAVDGAMLEEPVSFAGIRERQRFSLGLIIAAAKWRSKTGDLDENVVGWLRRLDNDVVGDFARRKLTDNLYVWSGVNAAVFLFISRDPFLREYQDEVWGAGVRQIGPDGHIASEIKRRSKALLYHHYYLSGLLALRRMRLTLKLDVSEEDDKAISRLSSFVQSGMCAQRNGTVQVGGYDQEVVPSDQAIVGSALDAGFLRPCEPNRPLAEGRSFDDLGGNIDRTVDLISRNPGRS